MGLISYIKDKLFSRESKPDLCSRFVYLLGVPGVGKTSQGKLLKKWLEAKGYKTLLVNIRTGHLFIYLLKKLNLIDYPRSAHEVGFWEREPLEREKTLFPLMYFFEVINTFILALARVFIPLALGYVVIAEQYVIDTCSDLQCRCKGFGMRKNARKRAARNLLKLMPDSPLLIHLKASYEELVKRYKQRQTPIEPPEYINFKHRHLLQSLKHFDACHINTEEKTIGEVHQKILQKLTG